MRGLRALFPPHKENAEAQLADSGGFFLISNYQEFSWTFPAPVQLQDSNLNVLIVRNGLKETLVSHGKQQLNEK